MIQYAIFETNSFYWLIGFDNVIRLRYDYDDEMWVMVDYFSHHVHHHVSDRPELAERI